MSRHPMYSIPDWRDRLHHIPVEPGVFSVEFSNFQRIQVTGLRGHTQEQVHIRGGEGVHRHETRTLPSGQPVGARLWHPKA